VLVFDLVVVAKALVQFEHPSGVLVFNLDASREATEQFEQAMEVEEAFLGHFLCLRLDCFFTCGYEELRSCRIWLMSACARWCLWLRGNVMSLREIPSHNL
jgi:hypothetical protein